jgi:EmrB/QacA subfamily drug resistance transporter
MNELTRRMPVGIPVLPPARHGEVPSASTRRTAQLAALVAVAFFMENLDSTVIVTALPVMARSFHADAVDLNIGVSAYTLTLAVLIPISDWAADRFGARRVFAAALVIFTGASVLCGLSQGLWSFTLCRVLQGTGGAMMMPVGRLVLLRSTAKSDLVRIIALIVWPGLIAPVLGPPVGGFIAHYLNWRWIFFLNAPLGLIGTWFALVLIERQRSDRSRRFDVLGFLLCASACVAVTYGLEVLGRASMGWLPAVAFIAAGAVSGTWAVLHLHRVEQPLLELSVLRVRTYVVTLCGGSLFRTSVTMGAFLLPLMFQLGFGLDSFTSGLLMLALFAGGLGMKSVTTRILRRYGFRSVLLVNGGLAGLTILGGAALRPSLPHIVTAAALGVMGVTRSLQLSAFNALAFADIPHEQLNAANTVASVAQQLSLAFGIAASALALRFAELLHHGLGADPTLADFRIALLVAGAMTLVSTLDSLTLPRGAGAFVSGCHAPEPESDATPSNR